MSGVTAAETPGQVEQRHRDEWQRNAQMAADAIEAGDADALRLAKLAAETIKLRQDCERKAWCLDKPDRGGDGFVIPPIEIVVVDAEDPDA